MYWHEFETMWRREFEVVWWREFEMYSQELEMIWRRELEPRVSGSFSTAIGALHCGCRWRPCRAATAVCAQRFSVETKMATRLCVREREGSMGTPTKVEHEVLGGVFLYSQPQSTRNIQMLSLRGHPIHELLDK